MNELIWCYQYGKIFQPNLMGIGLERDFYKLKELSSIDIATINKIMGTFPPHLRELNKGWIEAFNLAFRLRQIIENDGPTDPEVIKLLDEAIHNFEEDIHTRIENSAAQHMDSILGEDISFFHTEDGRIEFTYYICVQYMRTRKIRASVLDAVREIKSIDTEKIWNVLSHIFATNLASNIVTHKSLKMVLLKNQSALDFIAGDQPVINTFAVGSSMDTETKQLEFYYPVSPKLAILITERAELKDAEALMCSEADVDNYNKMIVDQMHSQLYGASDTVLRRYIGMNVS